MDFEHEIQELQHPVKKLEYPKGFPMYEQPKASSECNVPCNAAEETEPWNTKDAKIRRYTYGVGLRDGLSAIKPEERELSKKIDRLIAYFEKRSRENAKRAEKNEKRQYTEFQRLDEIVQKDRSGYFFSGKSEAYDNAAQKVRELLGKPEVQTCTRQAPHVCKENGPCNGFPKPEKWVIDMRPKHGPDKEWGPSGDSDVCGTFLSKAEAEEAIAHNGANLVERRARRIERLDERNPKPFVWVSQRFSTMNGFVTAQQPPQKPAEVEEDEELAAVDARKAERAEERRINGSDTKEAHEN